MALPRALSRCGMPFSAIMTTGSVETRKAEGSAADLSIEDTTDQETRNDEEDVHAYIVGGKGRQGRLDSRALAVRRGSVAHRHRHADSDGGLPRSQLANDRPTLCSLARPFRDPYGFVSITRAARFSGLVCVFDLIANRLPLFARIPPVRSAFMQKMVSGR